LPVLGSFASLIVAQGCWVSFDGPLCHPQNHQAESEVCSGEVFLASISWIRVSCVIRRS
jgi:hypothetical protein